MLHWRKNSVFLHKLAYCAPNAGANAFFVVMICRFLRNACLFVFLVLGLLACLPPRNPRNLRLEMLQGTWYAPKKGLYHTIYVQDSTHIAFDTHIDTVFFYEYKIEGDSLALYKPHGEFVNHNRILLLSYDSLVFDNLLDTGDRLYYTRVPPKWQAR
jgi:hypothetical protein